MSAPTTPTLDDFERSPENPLSNGGKWSELAPEWNHLQLASHSFSCSVGAIQTVGSGGQFGAMVWTETLFGADQEVHCQLTGGSTCGPTAALGEGFRLYLRAQQIGNDSTYDAYELIMHNETGPDTFTIRKIINGAYVGGDLAQVEVGIGGIPRYAMFRIKGTLLEGWSSPDIWATSALVISHTDSSISGAGYIGCGFQTNTSSFRPQIDNFGGGETVDFIPQIYRRTRG